MEYLVTLTPLEPYFFGTEQRFEYAGSGVKGFNSYYISSALMPEQTSILGVLRYVILEQNGLIHSDFIYSAQDREKMTELVGEKSFRFEEKSRQKFGMIQSLYPVFITNADRDYFVKNPLCNTAKTGFRSMKMSEGYFNTSSGSIKLPQKDAYNAKEGLVGGFYNLQKAETKDIDDIFLSSVNTGNRKNGTSNPKNKDGFFKRKCYTLRKGFAFAFFVETEENALPEETICYLGQKRSAFRFTAKPHENDLEQCVKIAFGGGEKWFYALSDCLAASETKNGFSIVFKKSVRNLWVDYSENNTAKRMSQSDKLLNLIESGSCFFEQTSRIQQNENCRNIGYNYCIEIGGNE